MNKYCILRTKPKFIFLVININLLHSFIKLKLPISTTKYKNLFSQTLKKVGASSQVFTLLMSIDMTPRF